jgi:serine protease
MPSKQTVIPGARNNPSKNGAAKKKPSNEHKTFGPGPRVVVKLRDAVNLSYEDGIEKDFPKWGVGPWDRLATHFAGCSFRRLYTAFPPEKIKELIRRGVEMDPTYKPANLLGYFVVDCPGNVVPELLAKELLRWPTVELAYVDPLASDPAVNATDDPLSPSQGYLDSAPGGIDARFAWGQTGGDGAGMNVIDLEQGWTLNHEDLAAHGANVLFGSVVNGSRPHGTSVLGEICAVDNTVGCVGIAPNVASLNVVSHSGVTANIPNGILTAVANLSFGDVLLLEVQLNFLPAESVQANFDTIRLATALGIVVVEAAGNGSTNLDTFVDAAGHQILNRASADFQDSGAVMVGAGSSTAPHTRLSFSNFGNRIDCYGWGENVESSTSDIGGATNLYTAGFNGTSSASPIVTGAAVSVQGMAQAGLGFRFSPRRLREILSDPANGTQSNTPATDQIGVMPDLRGISTNVLGVSPDIYIRDFVGDAGNPHNGSISDSPDIILLKAAVANPQASFGAGSGTENFDTLGSEAEFGQDNFIYVRLLNRGGVGANNVTATVYWSPPATLVTPNLWTLVGSVNIAAVPSGNLLTVSDALTWPAAAVPATGHYCFVGLIGNAQDPAPSPADFVNFTNYESYIRNNNNVTWRNFNIVNNDPSAQADPANFVALPFLAPGTPDKARRMGLEVMARLPEGSRVFLEAPVHFLDALDHRSPFYEQDRKKKLVRIPVSPHGNFILGEALFPAGSKTPLRLLVNIPKQFRRNSYNIYARQTFEGREVGRITWQLRPERSINEQAS